MTSYICPTITALNSHQYRSQLEAVQPFAKRIHLDLMDGQFAPTRSPELDQIWWPDDMTIDIHLMYQKPMPVIESLIKLSPSLVVIHLESEVDHHSFANQLHQVNIRAGLALLAGTPVELARPLIGDFDHALIFSGNLGHHGGHANLALLSKVRELKQLKPELEIAWDGGINDQNALKLVEAGVSVLNVGGFIQDSADPARAYAKIEKLIA